MKKTLTAVKEHIVSKATEEVATTNSGIIIEEIRDSLKMVSKPWDFSSFPIDGEKIEGLTLTNIQPISFTNVGPIYHSLDELKERFGIEHPEELSGWYIVYDKILDTGGHYFGMTRNYGQRSLEHSLTNVSGEYEHYSDFRKYGRCLIRVLAITKTEKYATDAEEKFIGDFVREVFKEKFPTANIHNFGRKEIAKMVSDKIYNKKLPITIYD